MTVYEGCCGDDSWRGRHCQYHQGYQDALDDVSTLERAEHEAYADPIDGGWSGYQAACWSCDWRSLTVHPTGSEGKGKALDEAREHRRQSHDSDSAQ